MARAGGERVRRLFQRAADAGSLGGVIFEGIGAVLLAVGTALASGVLTIADVLIVPLSALTGAVGDLIDAIFGGAAQIIDIGALATALSIGPGGMFNLGPLTFALAIGSVLLGLYVVVAYLSEEPTGNFFPGIPFDIPTPGFTGPEEDEDT
ncbi:hypothetical protein [Halomicrobium salinisoli]|uniref:hypothetical protein n=1 Tax=Halomicrobium salinisoli TaxID=2878391 RepID=UPI001CF09B05|nr:hypothetical protein [Halomicrobium salinisoli]